MEDKLKAYAELEERMRHEPNNWTLFFEAAELWQSIQAQMWEARDAEEAFHQRRCLDRLVENYRPSWWGRLRIKLAKRG